jgi:hypothetical protein
MRINKLLRISNTAARNPLTFDAQRIGTGADFGETSIVTGAAWRKTPAAVRPNFEISFAAQYRATRTDLGFLPASQKWFR